MQKKLANKYQYDDLLIRSQDPYANAKYEVILRWLAKKGVKSILNAGCGSGELSFILDQKGYVVSGIDNDRDYIDLANKNVKKIGTRNCIFILSSIEDYKPSKKYDAVIATDVLEHIKNDKFAFEKLASFVKDGGAVVITVPAGQYLYGLHDEQLKHFRRYSMNSFKKIIPKTLKTKEIRFFGFFLIPVALLLSRLLRRDYPMTVSKVKNKKSFISRTLNFIINNEKIISFPYGTSLLFWGDKKS